MNINFKKILIIFCIALGNKAVYAQSGSSLAGSCNVYMNSSVLNRATSFGEEQIVNGNYQGVAQQYNGLTGQLKSVFFRGRVNPAASSSSNTVKVVVYNANLGYPGTIIGSQNVIINSAPASYDVLATFSSPLNVNGDVIISIEPFSPATDNFFVQRNTPPDGQFLNLTKIKQANQWFKNLAAGDPNFDFDFIIIPVTTTSLTAAFTSNTALNITTFTNSSINGVNYEWDFGDGGTSTAVSPTHNYAASNIYNVRLIAFGNGITPCADTLTSPINVVLTSLQDVDDNHQELFIQNNMVTDILVVESKEQMTIKIIDSIGNEVKVIQLEKNEKRNIDTRSLATGVYYLQTQNQNKLKFVKLGN